MRSTTTRTGSLRIERTYRASAQAVFDAWTSPEVIQRWWHAGPDWETPEASVDLRAGGAFSVTMRDAGGVEHRGRGRYTVVESPKRLAWLWEGDGEARTGSIVEVEFREVGDATTVVLTQKALPNEHVAEEFTEGWRLCLANLDEALGA